MNTIKNHKLIVPEGNPVTLDVYWLADNKPKPIVVFAHGFKGFKDHYTVLQHRQIEEQKTL